MVIEKEKNLTETPEGGRETPENRVVIENQIVSAVDQEIQIQNVLPTKEALIEKAEAHLEEKSEIYKSIEEVLEDGEMREFVRSQFKDTTLLYRLEKEGERIVKVIEDSISRQGGISEEKTMELMTEWMSNIPKPEGKIGIRAYYATVQAEIKNKTMKILEIARGMQAHSTR